MAATPSHRASSGERINNSGTTGHLTKALGERGIRLTRQRRGSLQVVGDAPPQLDVEQNFRSKVKNFLADLMSFAICARNSSGPENFFSERRRFQKRSSIFFAATSPEKSSR